MFRQGRSNHILSHKQINLGVNYRVNTIEETSRYVSIRTTNKTTENSPSYENSRDDIKFLENEAVNRGERGNVLK